MIGPNTVVFDIDGVLADPRHRLHHILDKEPPDWPTFEELTMLDKPFIGMLSILSTMASNPRLNIVLLTSRTDRNEVRAKTVKWLERQGICAGTYNHLVMRSSHDERPSILVKLANLEAMGITPDMVMTIFEDQPDVVTGLRAAGYHVCDVGGWEGDFVEIADKGVINYDHYTGRG